MKTLKQQLWNLVETRLEPVLCRRPRIMATRRSRGFSIETLECRALLAATNLGFASETVATVVSPNTPMSVLNTGVVVDSAGNSYVTGSYAGTVDFAPGPTTDLSSSSGGFRNLFVEKLDTAGNLVWKVPFSGGYSTGEAIALGTTGDVLVTGSFSGTIDFDPGFTIHSLTSISGSADVFVLQLNAADGSFQAVGQMGGTDTDRGTGIAVDANGAVLVTGGFYSTTVDMHPGASKVVNLANAGGEDIFFSIFSQATNTTDFTDGQYYLAERIGGTQQDHGSAVAVDPNGNFCLTGRFSGTPVAQYSSSGSLGGFNLNVTSNGATDVFVLQVGSGGGHIWIDTFGSTGYDYGNAITVDSTGNVYVGGSFTGSADFNPGSGVRTLTSDGSSDDGFVLKLNPAGAFLYADRLGGNQSDTVNGVSVDAEGNLYSTGRFGQRASLGSSSTAQFIYGAYSGSTFVARQNVNGTFNFGTSVGDPGSQCLGNAIAIGPGNSIIVAGQFGGTADFDPGSGKAIRTNLQLTTGGYVLSLVGNLNFTVPDNAHVVVRKNGARIEIADETTSTVLQDGLLAETTGIRITGGPGFEVVKLDFSAGGSFAFPNGITIDGKGGTEALKLIGTGNEGFTIRPGETTGQGTVIAYGQTIQFTNVFLVRATKSLALLIQPEGTGGTDNLGTTISSGLSGGPGTAVNGTTAGTAWIQVIFDNIPNVTIDTGENDGVSSAADDVITVVADSLVAAGLKNFTIQTGKGNDTMIVNGPNIGLPVPGGAFWLLAGAGVDRLRAVGDVNWDLNDVRLVSGGGGRLQHDDIEEASLTGGGSANHLNASQFSGDVSLDGLVGNDLLQGGSGDDLLAGGTGNDRLLGHGGNDQLYGQDGDDQLWGDAGDDVLNGGNSNDRLCGGDGNDVLRGDTGNDQLDGGQGDDNLNGGTGLNLLILQGTANSESLSLQKSSATAAQFKRKPRGLTSVLEQDSITMNATDEFLVYAFDGDDLIAIDLTFSQLGSIDGGNGTDTCTAPAAWTKVSC